jgi:hypothetical protein
VSEVRLDGCLGDEEALRDLAVGRALGGEPSTRFVALSGVATIERVGFWTRITAKPATRSTSSSSTRRSASPVAKPTHVTVETEEADPCPDPPKVPAIHLLECNLRYKSARPRRNGAAERPCPSVSGFAGSAGPPQRRKAMHTTHVISHVATP